MTNTKPCHYCGNLVERPRNTTNAVWAARKYCSYVCSRAARRRDTPKQYIPCRICGEPTRYHGTTKNHLFGMLHCEKPACVEASRLVKNSRIGAAHHQMIVKGTKKMGSWKGVPLISKEEHSLESWFLAQGWQTQVKVSTCVRTYKLPRFARCDFALPERKLFIEIDGTSHRDRKDRDDRRDALLAVQGWRGLRINAQDVRTSPDDVKQRILQWAEASSIIYEEAEL